MVVPVADPIAAVVVAAAAASNSVDCTLPSSVAVAVDNNYSNSRPHWDSNVLV